MKRAIAIVMVIGMFFMPANEVQAYGNAAELQAKSPIIVMQPMLARFTYVGAYITKSGKTLTGSSSVSTKPGMSFSGTVYIQKYANGSWSSVAQTNISGTGTGSASVSYTGLSGYSYRTKVVVTSGTETVTNYSNTTSL